MWTLLPQQVLLCQRNERNQRTRDAHVVPWNNRNSGVTMMDEERGGVNEHVDQCWANLAISWTPPPLASGAWCQEALSSVCFIDITINCITYTCPPPDVSLGHLEHELKTSLWVQLRGAWWEAALQDETQRTWGELFLIYQYLLSITLGFSFIVLAGNTVHQGHISPSSLLCIVSNGWCDTCSGCTQRFLMGNHYKRFICAQFWFHLQIKWVRKSDDRFIFKCSEHLTLWIAFTYNQVQLDKTLRLSKAC